MIWLKALWLAARTFFGKALNVVINLVKGFVDWFKGLSPTGKVAFILVLSVVLNAWQWHLHGNLKSELKDCKEARDLVGNKVHEDRQNILDFLVQSAKLETDKRIEVIEHTVVEKQVVYEKVAAANPLPTRCEFGDDRVQAANQAISELTAGAVRHD